MPSIRRRACDQMGFLTDDFLGKFENLQVWHQRRSFFRGERYQKVIG
jgi:hypothetical protein